MAAENCTSCRKYALTVSLNIWVRMDFPHEVRFSAGIGPAHFPAATTRPLGRGCLPFSPCFEFSCCDILVKMDWRRWASIARLSIRIMCCPNGSRKLLTQKIIIRPYQAGPVYFLHEVRFSAGIGPAHFPAVTTRPLRPRLSAIFSLLLITRDLMNQKALMELFSK